MLRTVVNDRILVETMAYCQLVIAIAYLLLPQCQKSLRNWHCFLYFWIYLFYIFGFIFPHIVTNCIFPTVPNLHQLPQGLGHMPPMHHGLPPNFHPGLGPHQGLPQLPSLNPSAMMGMGISPAMANHMAHNMAAVRFPPGMAQSGCVILVSNLDEEVCN